MLSGGSRPVNGRTCRLNLPGRYESVRQCEGPSTRTSKGPPWEQITRLAYRPLLTTERIRYRPPGRPAVPAGVVPGATVGPLTGCPVARTPVDGVGVTVWKPDRMTFDCGNCVALSPPTMRLNCGVAIRAF